MFDWLQADVADFTDWRRLLQTLVRLLVAAVLGGIVGYEREKTGKAAGLRTHMLVAASTALAVLVPQLEGMQLADLSRVVQGILTGIGFLGGGAILKLEGEKQIHGLTTAAGIWLTAVVGVTVGFGRLGTACAATVLCLVILSALAGVEKWLAPENKNR
jgi:putative Mg2+ transporter-C (MgtC) family protein